MSLKKYSLTKCKIWLNVRVAPLHVQMKNLLIRWMRWRSQHLYLKNYSNLIILVSVSFIVLMHAVENFIFACLWTDQQLHCSSKQYIFISVLANCIFTFFFQSKQCRHRHFLSNFHTSALSDFKATPDMLTDIVTILHPPSHPQHCQFDYLTPPSVSIEFLTLPEAAVMKPTLLGILRTDCTGG